MASRGDQMTLRAFVEANYERAAKAVARDRERRDITGKGEVKEIVDRLAELANEKGFNTTPNSVGTIVYPLRKQLGLSSSTPTPPRATKRGQETDTPAKLQEARDAVNEVKTIGKLTALAFENYEAVIAALLPYQEKYEALKAKLSHIADGDD
ncbi:MAG: hypothetical protein VE98_C0001G0253 [candidate division Kazan bacterium GW2011_GWA1_50_15]|uniref:Uncharacterized protein n=2 Tax=Bacteria division Kazan-3B-28 TaxID=1798534 RepID=A0A0G1X6J3_UNCK3|nr:MAG: hypothetical protein VE98_C0001G0253 [candidate division Kazan bacterium GW2011_GWA1_50_15]KKW25472.1 MAG: hypothetical protein VE99_C0001G0109 [candidate division Kazan bacterium GW2011_GWC1_52_13]KKW26778.1 MAG: hypothetical protein VF00_C0002G0103 [candidate division Kazan bacterium GW2011_GWB1_52_7]